MTIHGTLRFRDLGSGAWSLEAEDGPAHDLDVRDISPERLRALDGQRVTIVARPGGVGFGMTGASSWVVESICKAG